MMMTDSIWSLQEIIICDASFKAGVKSKSWHWKTVGPSALRRGLFVVRGNKTKRMRDTGKGKERPTGLRSFRLRFVSPTSCSLTSEVVLLTCWISSLTAFAWDQCLKERGIYMRIVLFCIMAERTKHKHERRSFRFLVERHNTLANGTLAKRFVGETTVHRPERGFFPLPIFPRALMFIAVFLAVFIGILRFNKEIFFLPP